MKLLYLVLAIGTSLLATIEVWGLLTSIYCHATWSGYIFLIAYFLGLALMALAIAGTSDCEGPN